MEGQSVSGLPFAAVSLHAFAPAGVSANRTARPQRATTSNAVILDRSRLRSHPIASELPVTPVHDGKEDVYGKEGRREQRRKPSSLGRFVSAVPAALGRLLSAPIHRSPFLDAPTRLSDVRIFPTEIPRRAACGGGSDGRRPAGGGGGRPAIMWFRSDLRLHDNPALERACREGSAVLPVYIFDPREYGNSAGSAQPRSGPARTSLLLSCLADLRCRLHAAGSELLLRVGRPEAVLAALAEEAGAGAVVCQQEVTQEEAQVESRVRGALQRVGCRLDAQWGGSLVAREDLPFRLESLPASYSDFRSRLGGLSVRPMVQSEEGIKGLPQGLSIEPGELPTLQQLGFASPPTPAAPHLLSSSSAAPARGSGYGSPLLLPQSAAAAAAGGGGGAAGGLAGVRGGESEALRALQGFVQELKNSFAQQQQQHRHQQQSRHTSASSSSSSRCNSPSAALSAFSCRISPWLALGCLSPRRVFHELRQHLGGPAVIACPPAPVTAAAATTTAGGVAATTAAPALQAQSAAAVSHATRGSGSSSTCSSNSSSGSQGDWLVFELLWRDFFRFVSLKYTQQHRQQQQPHPGGSAAGAHAASRKQASVRPTIATAAAATVSSAFQPAAQMAGTVGSQPALALA